MDLNVVVLGGRLAAPPEVRHYDSGTRMIRYLVTVRSDRPKPRVDVVPVTQWDPAASEPDPRAVPGARLFVAGGVRRRFWDDDVGKRSRLEVIALHIEVQDDDPEER